MNPFEQKPYSLKQAFMNWRRMYPKAYNKHEVNPYTKTRIILANGNEFEANWFSHQFARHTGDNCLRREIALVRETEKEQQLKISLLKPINETVLEHTISYEQLAVDLTAELAKREKDCYVKKALDFALLEDFDHLYRYSDLLLCEQGVYAEKLVGRYTEIMPGRPTVAHHRMPSDNVRRSIDSSADVATVLCTMTITAAEQQTMNYYMNVTNFANTEQARRLYQEIALVEEEHVTQYESLMNSSLGWFEMLLWHEYAECYLYWSNYCTETDAYVKRIWEECFVTEITHLHKAAELLEKYEGKHWQQVVGCGEFPAPLSLHENIDYVRSVLKNTVQFTSVGEDYERVEELPAKSDFFCFQNMRNEPLNIVPSHRVIENTIYRRGQDYRFEKAPNPVPELRNRKCDNTSVGRVPYAADSDGFCCNGE